jgi:hypothetical protein
MPMMVAAPHLTIKLGHNQVRVSMIGFITDRSGVDAARWRGWDRRSDQTTTTIVGL